MRKSPEVRQWGREMVSWLSWQFALTCLKCASSANTWTWCCCGSWSDPIMLQPQAPGPVTLMDIWLALTGFSLPVTWTDVTECSVSCSHLAGIWEKTKALLYSLLSSWRAVCPLYISFTAASEDFFYLNTFNLIARLKLANDSKLRYNF